MTARTIGRQVNLTLIQCYAPTYDSDDTTKDAFCDQLQAEIEAAPCHDQLIVMGDLKAIAGNDSTYYYKAMGRAS